MKKIKPFLLPLILILAALACGVELPEEDPFGDIGNDDVVESFEALPFYGELNFLVLEEGSELPLAGVQLKIDELPVDGVDENDIAYSDEDGFIIVNQNTPGVGYYGDNGPEEPIFTFSAPGYETAVFTGEQLAEATGYDPYDNPDELFEFTIYLFPLDGSATLDESGTNSASSEAVDLLLVATTSEEEREAFSLLWDTAIELGFSAFDANGEQVELSGDAFPDNVASITLRIDGQSIVHQLIDPENIFWLMEE